jgi:hypothetical protein
MVFLDEEHGRREALLARLHEELGERFDLLYGRARRLSRDEMIDIAMQRTSLR